MAKNEEYRGSIDIISGLRPKNGANFPVAEAADILTGANDKRLDADLTEIFAQLLTMATKAYVQEKISDLVSSSPEALDTLNELAAALGNDPNFSTTILNMLSNKVDKVEGKGLSTNDFNTEYLNKLRKAVTVYNGEFNKADSITVVSSGSEIRDTGISIDSVMKFKYVWFADIDVIVDTSSISIVNLTATPIGSINDFKDSVSAFAVMSGTYDSENNQVKINLSPEDGIVRVASSSSYYSTLSTGGIASAKELAVIKSSLYNYTMFNNGDLLFTTGITGANYKRIPLYEVKYNSEKGIELMGFASPWDKQQINKIPSIEAIAKSAESTANSSLSTAKARLPIFTSPNPAEGWQTDWLFDQGWYLGGIKYSCGGHPPVLNGNYTAWAVLVLENMPFKSTAGSDVTADATYRLQIAYDLINSKTYMRISETRTSTGWGRWIDTSKENEFLIADYMASAQTDGTDTGNLIEKTIPVDTDIITVQLANTSSDVRITIPSDVPVGWECLVHLNSAVYSLFSLLHNEVSVFSSEPSEGYEGWYKIKYTANGWDKIRGVNPITKIGEKEITADKLADGAVTEDKLSDRVKNSLVEVINCTVGDNDYTWSFSGNYRSVIFNNYATGDKATFAFPTVAPNKTCSEQKYESYKVIIYNNVIQRSCSMFGIDSGVINSTIAGKFEFDIVYNFETENWSVVNYTIVPYSEVEE
ncbi:MAG: hypothetical protein ACI3XA_04615 [Clostridia bacterium]